MTQDRVGLAWRGDLAVGILEHLDRIDVLEVLADPLGHAPREVLAAFASLARDRPLYLHGTGMGLATSWMVPQAHITRMARLVDRIRPHGWSEHLAMVRAGDVEIGHLTAPPRTQHNQEGTIRNIERACRTIGSPPLLENIASLVEPPGDGMSEVGWATPILAAAGVPWLLDLHNLYANARNRGQDPIFALHQWPLQGIGCIHLAGGVWLNRNGESTCPDAPDAFRLLDDHQHPVPADVFTLLSEVAAFTSQPLTVLIERDGAYPHFAEMLGEIDRARKALAEGRCRRANVERPVAALG